MGEWGLALKKIHRSGQSWGHFVFGWGALQHALIHEPKGVPSAPSLQFDLLEHSFLQACDAIEIQ